MNEQKIKEVFSDQDFVDNMLGMETAEDVQKALAEKGLELSLSEIQSIKNSLENNEGELSEESLENVAGGSITAIVCGLIIGAAAAGGAFGIGKAVHNWTERRW